MVVQVNERWYWNLVEFLMSSASGLGITVCNFEYIYIGAETCRRELYKIIFRAWFGYFGPFVSRSQDFLFGGFNNRNFVPPIFFRGLERG